MQRESTSPATSSVHSNTSAVNHTSIDMGSNATSSGNARSSNTRDLHGLFNDDEPDRRSDDELEIDEASSEKHTKEKHRKEPWDENIQREDRYHNEMMKVQRESLSAFKDFMSQIIDCFKPK